MLVHDSVDDGIGSEQAVDRLLIPLVPDLFKPFMHEGGIIGHKSDEVQLVDRAIPLQNEIAVKPVNARGESL